MFFGTARTSVYKWEHYYEVLNPALNRTDSSQACGRGRASYTPWVWWYEPVWKDTINRRGMWSSFHGKQTKTHHEGFEVRSPPLRQTITNLPFIVYAMRCIELTRFRWRREAVIKSPFEALNFVFTRFKVVSWTERSRIRNASEYNTHLHLVILTVWRMHLRSVASKCVDVRDRAQRGCPPQYGAYQSLHNCSADVEVVQLPTGLPRAVIPLY